MVGRVGGVLLAFAVSTFGLSAFAQNETPARVPEDEADLADSLLTDSEQENPLRSAIAAIAFAIDKEKKRASVQYGWESDQFSTLIKVAGPLDEKRSSTTLATHESLSNDTTAEFAMKRFVWRQAPLSPEQMSELCIASGRGRNCGSKDLTPNNRAIFDKQNWSAWLFGTSLKLGTQEFKYVDVSTSADQKETRTGGSGAFGVGFMPSRSIYFVSLTIRHESAYKGADTFDVCTPLAGSSATKCREAALKPPTRKIKNIATVEARRFIGDYAALSPRIAYEQKDSVFSIEVPLYFRQPDGPFNGGITLGWDDAQQDLRATLFVGLMPTIR